MQYTLPNWFLYAVAASQKWWKNVRSAFNNLLWCPLFSCFLPGNFWLTRHFSLSHFSQGKDHFYLPGAEYAPLHRWLQQAPGELATISNRSSIVVNANYFTAVSCSTSKLIGFSLNWFSREGKSGSSVSSYMFTFSKISMRSTFNMWSLFLDIQLFVLPSFAEVKTTNFRS